MKRTVVVVLVAIFASLALTGCDMVIGMILGENLSVERVDTVMNDGGLAAIEIGFGNEGMPRDNVEFVVVLSSDFHLDLYGGDFTVYVDEVDLGFHGNTEETVPAHWFDLTGIPDGAYNVGVYIDPTDEFDEDDEGDNDRFTSADAQIVIEEGDGGFSDTLVPDEFDGAEGFDNEWGGATDLRRYNNHPHNFHDPDDVDWIWFDVEAEVEVHVTTQLPWAGALSCDPRVNVHMDMGGYLELIGIEMISEVGGYEVFRIPAYHDARTIYMEFWEGGGQIGDYGVGFEEFWP